MPSLLALTDQSGRLWIVEHTGNRPPRMRSTASSITWSGTRNHSPGLTGLSKRSSYELSLRKFHSEIDEEPVKERVNHADNIANQCLEWK